MEIIQNAFHDSLIQMSNLLCGPQILQFFGGHLSIAIAMMLIPLLGGVIGAFLLKETNPKMALMILAAGSEMSQVLIFVVSIAAANVSTSGIGWVTSMIMMVPVIAVGLTMAARMKRMMSEEMQSA